MTEKNIDLILENHSLKNEFVIWMDAADIALIVIKDHGAKQAGAAVGLRMKKLARCICPTRLENMSLPVRFPWRF